MRLAELRLFPAALARREVGSFGTNDAMPVPLVLSARPPGGVPRLVSAQPRSLAASPATCRPWKRAMASSLAVGERSPLGPAMVVAP